MRQFIFLIFFVSALMYGQIKIRQGIPVKTDGVIETGEWKDAAEFRFEKAGNIICSFKLKQSVESLNILYEMKCFKDSTIIMPEIFIDTKNDGGEKWNDNDAWFHVSAQDCFAMGKREDYTGCKVEGAGWSAVPNYPFGNNWKRIEAIEIIIPFKKINIKKGSVIGICFSAGIFPGDLRLIYPKGASENIPSTWEKFIVE